MRLSQALFCSQLAKSWDWIEGAAEAARGAQAFMLGAPLLSSELAAKGREAGWGDGSLGQVLAT